MEINAIYGYIQVSHKQERMKKAIIIGATSGIGNELAKIAELNNVNLEFEASVAGGIPILRSIKEGLATNKISKVYGILNGTSNYILSEMENSNQSFSQTREKLRTVRTWFADIFLKSFLVNKLQILIL